MPPRYAYWTIIAGGLPTAFRAAERDDLLPTFQRIKEKHPDAQMKWFARGKLWESPDAARVAQHRGGRDRNWRPGGEHRDPRQKFIDAKKERNSALRKERWQRKNTEGGKGGKGGKGWKGQEESPSRPLDPNREPKPSENPEPTRPPHPEEPNIPPPGPPERGRANPRRPFRAQRKFPRGPRRG